MRRNGLTSWADRAAFEHLEDRLLLTAAGESPAIQLFQTSPALFVENQGQWADPPCECEKVRYAFHGSGASIAFTDAGPIFQVFRQAAAGDRHGLEDSAEPVPLGLDLEGHASSWPFGDDAPSWPFGDDASSWPTYADATERIPPNTLTEMVQFSVSFEGANAVSPIGLDMSESYFNYCIGDQARWRENVPAYGTIAYMGLWDGIDLFCTGRRDRLKYEFHIAPGADYSRIRIRYEGIEGLSIDDAGALQIDLGDGWAPLVDDAPLIYQDVPASAGQAGIDGRRVDVPGEFVLLDDLAYIFRLTGPYDPAAELIIDPDMGWSTYLGGSGHDCGYAIALDGSGNVLVTGTTQCSGWTSGGFDTTYNGDWDAFVAKLSPTGGHIWSTYLGGSGEEYGYGIAVDGSGNVLVTGYTTSSGWTSGGFDTTYNGSDAFVAKLSPTGGHIWSTYLGGSDYECGYGIAVDASGNALVAGRTGSDGWTSGGFDTTHNGGSDAYVAKLSPTGGHMWSTYLGGSGWDGGSGIAVDGSGNALVTGSTESSGWTSGGFDTTYNGGCDGFVAELSPTGEHVWSTYLGGSAGEWGSGIAVDIAGNVLVTGNTQSSGWVSGGWDTSYNGGDWGDAFVAKLSPTGGHIWSTYLGGSDYDHGRGIAVDASGNALVTGLTDSPGWALGGFDTTYNGSGDAFLVKLSPTGAHLWSTYMGGTSDDDGCGIAVHASGNALVTGNTSSSGWTSGGFDTSFNGYCDAFVAVARIADLARAEVSARYMFYDGSIWDGGGSGANPGNDLAVAPGKNALLPGLAASSSNQTSYGRGINGVIVDIASLWYAPGVSAADFLFRVGNDNDPETWSSAPVPSSVTVRPGEGVDGSDRVTIIWPDNAIQNTWLQVSVLETFNTGLEEPDVFYFGSAIGETGNDPTNAIVDEEDVRLVEANFTDSAAIDNPYDFNRDGRVDAVDAQIARDNATTLVTSLKLITVPGPGLANPLPRVLGAVRNAGWGAYDALLSLGLVLTEAASVDRDDLVLTRDRTGQQVPIIQAAFTYDPPTCLAMWNLSGIPIGPGRYTARVVAAGVADRQGGLLDGNGDGTGGDDYTVPVLVTYRGDCDVDGDVDFFDYLTVKASFGKAPARWEDGDTDGDADVDFYDYLTVKANFGQTVGGEAEVLASRDMRYGAKDLNAESAESAENAGDTEHRRQEERPEAPAAEAARGAGILPAGAVPRRPEAGTTTAGEALPSATESRYRGPAGQAERCRASGSGDGPVLDQCPSPAGLPSAFDVESPPAGEAGSTLDTAFRSVRIRWPGDGWTCPRRWPGTSWAPTWPRAGHGRS